MKKNNNYQGTIDMIEKIRKSMQEVPVLKPVESKPVEVKPIEQPKNTLQTMQSAVAKQGSLLPDMSLKSIALGNVSSPVENTSLQGKNEPKKEYKTLDYYTKKDLEEERNNIRAKGQSMTSLESKRMREINKQLDADDKAKSTPTKRQDNYLVHRDRYDELMKDGRLANDIDTLVDVIYNNANQDATVSKEWADEYGAKNITGGLNKKNFIDQLSKRYELTPAELEDMALTRYSDKKAEEQANEREGYNKFGKEHTVLGSGLSLLGTIGSSGEGLVNTALAGVTGDDRYTSRMFDTLKGGLREGVKQNIDSNAGKFAYDIGMGVGDMASGAAVGSAPFVLAGNTANRELLNSIDKGIDPRQAALYAGLSGITDYVTNKIGLDKAKKLAIQSLKGNGALALKRAGIAGLGEAGENVLQDIAQTFLDEVINGEDSDLRMSYADKIAKGMSEEQAYKETFNEYLIERGISAATGFGMGAVMQGGESWLNSKRAKNQTESVPRVGESPSLIEEITRQNVNDIDIDSNEYKYNVRENLIKQIHRMATEGLGENEPLEVGATPSIFLKYGADQLPLRLNQSDAYKIAYPEGYMGGKHNLGFDAIADLLYYLSDPDMLLKSDTQPNSIVAFVNMIDENGYPVMAAVHLNKNGFIEPANQIASMYGRRDFDNWIETQAKKGNILYTKQEGTSSTHPGVQFPNASSKADPFVNSNVNPNNGSVNSNQVESIAENKVSSNIADGEMNTRMEMNLQFFSDLMEQKKSLEAQARAEGLSAEERASIQNQIKDIDSQLTGLRKTIANTAVKAGIVTPEEIANDPELNAIATYIRHSNEAVVNQARQNLLENAEQIKNDYVSGKKEIKTDLDVDQGMQLLKGEQGDLDNYERNSILRNMAEHGTEAGQFIQAFKKYSDTAEGALITATKVNSEKVDKWKSQNKKAVGTNKTLAEALTKQGYDGSMEYEKPILNHEQLRQQVVNTLATEFASIEDQFSDSDIDYLTNMLEHNISVGDLTEALNTKMATGRFGISDETQAKVNQLFDEAKQYDENSREFVERQAEAFRLLAEETAPDATPLEKFDAWRYMAMLGNPKTMLRNLVGNKMFSAVTGVSNNLAAIIEGGVDKLSKNGIQRTKAVLNPVTDRALLKATLSDAYGKRYRQIEGSKYEKMDKDALRQNRSVFNSKIMRLAEKAVDEGISDTKAVANKYSTSMAGYMKANGLTLDDLEASKRYDQLDRTSKQRVLSKAEKAEMDDLRDVAQRVDKARDYALKQAEYATFHEDNRIAELLSRASRTGAAEKVLVEGLVPFKKTPVNILKSGVDYSPLGALKSIAETGKLIYENTGSRKGNLEDTYQVRNPLTHGYKDVNKTLASDVIESWSKTITGSAMAALGYYLYNKGILHSSTKDEKYQDDLEGKQNYSIEINGKTYTIDWAVPGVMPLLLGAEVSKAFKDNAISDEKWYNNPDKMFETVSALFEPVIETSMLQGVENTISSLTNKYDDSSTAEKIANAAAVMGSSYLTQAIPTLSGQIARTVDNTRRSTDTKNEGFLGVLEKQGRKVMNKIPVLSEYNNPYVDARGEQRQNAPYDNVLGRLAYQTLSPWYAQDIDTRGSDVIARNAYNGLDANGKPIRDADVFADWKSQVKVNGEKLNPDEMFTYRTESGKANTEVREALSSADWFNSLDADKQTEILKSLNNMVKHVGLEALDKNFTNNKYFDAYSAGGTQGLLDYIQDGIHKDEVKDAIGSTKDWAMEIYDSGNQADIDKAKKANEIITEFGKDNLTKKQWETYQKSGEAGLRKMLKDEEAENKLKEQHASEYDVLKQNGYSSETMQKKYESAKKKIPSLTAESFSKQYKAMDTDKNENIKQDEVLSYLNKGNYSQAEANKLWNAYGNNWKQVPVLKDGKWTKAKK